VDLRTQCSPRDSCWGRIGMVFGRHVDGAIRLATVLHRLGLASLLWLGPWLKWMPKNQAATQTDYGGAPSLPIS